MNLLYKINKAKNLILNLKYYLTKQNDYCLIFLHIPKCGGTSFSKLIQINYAPWKTLRISGPSREDENTIPITIPENGKLDYKHFGIDLNSYQNYDCIMGHIPFGMHKFIKKEVKYITVVRDPIDRVWSAYNHLVNQPTHRFYNTLKKYNFSLIEYMENEKHPGWRNEQSRILLGINNLDLNNYPFEDFKNHLNKYFYKIIPLKKTEASISILAKDLNWKIDKLEKHNIGVYKKAKPAPTQAEIDVILKYNKLDSLLFEYIQNR